MADANAILSFQGKDDGLQKILKSASDGFGNLADSVSQGKDNLAGLKDESGLFEKTFKGLTGTVGKGQKAFDNLGDSASAIGDGFSTSAKVTDVTSKGFVRFAASALGVGKQVGFVNTVLGPMGDLWHEVDDAQSAVGKGFAVLNAVSKPLIGSLKAASEFTAELADKMSGLGEAGKSVAGIMLGVSKSLGGLAGGVKVADVAGDIYRLVEAMKEFSEESLPELIEQAKSAYEMFEKTGLKASLFGDTLKTLRTTATVLQATTKGLTKELSGMFLGFLQFKETAGMVKGFASALYDSYLRMKGLSEATDAFQSMGLDTTMANLAVKVGAFGEGLLGNAEAAKEFVNTTVAAFAQVQDKIGYLQTLSTAAAESQQTLFKSFQGLTRGPLKNAITTADAASASYFAMSAGADTLSKSNLLMTATAKGAVAGQVDQSQAINALTNAMGPYKMNFRDADKVMGQFFATTEAGQLDLGNLTGAIGELSSSSASANIPMAQTLGMFAALTKVGPPGEAATRLSNLLQDVSAVSETAQDELDRLGIRLDKYTIQQKGLLPLLQEIYTKTGGSVEKMRKIFANDYSFQAFQGLVSNMKDANKIIESVGNSGGETLDKMFDKRRETLMQQGTALMNGFKDVMADLGQRVLPLLEPGIKFLNQILENFQQMPEWQKNMIAGIAMSTIAMQKVSEVGGTFTGILMNLGKTYLVARGMSLFWSGQLLNEAGIIKDLIVKHQDYGGALLRLFGIQKQGASVATTILSAQEETTKAVNLGKQAETLRTQATKAQEVAARLQAQAEILRSEAVTLSAEADIAAANATNLRAEADAAGGANAKLNADAQKAEAAATNITTIADRASADAVQAKTVADAKSVEATKARQAAETAAHNADLAQKNASIRLNQAVSVATKEAVALGDAAVEAQKKATLATTTALELEAVATEKAAIATKAKAVADEAGGANALLNAKATVLQKEAAIAQTAASEAATKAIELNVAATKAEETAVAANTVRIKTQAEAEIAAAFATAKNTEAKVENEVVNLANDKVVETLDATTGAVVGNTAKVEANTGAKVANKATSLADDTTVQTLEVVDGVVQTNTVNVEANTGAKTANAATTATATTAEAVNTVETEVNTGATVANTQARGLLGKINAFLTGQINLNNVAMLYNNAVMKTGVTGMGLLNGATKLFAGGMGLARGAVTAFATTLGPITLAIAGLYLAFNIFKDLAETFGLIGSEYTEMAKKVKDAEVEFINFKATVKGVKEDLEDPKPADEGWLRKTLDWLGLVRHETEEYSGFLNTKLYPLLNLSANLGDKLLTGGGSKKQIDEFFKGLKDKVEEARQAQLSLENEAADEATGREQDKTLQMVRDASQGRLLGVKAQKLLDEAKAEAIKTGQSALAADPFKKVLDANRKAAEDQTKINDKRVEQLTAQINDPKISKARKEQLQSQVDFLKKQSSALDEYLKKEDKYFQSLQDIALAVDENNAALSSEKTIENLKKQQKELTDGVSGPLKDAYDGVFDSLEKGMNNTGLAQRRMNNQLVQAVKNFQDNIKEAKDISNFEDLTKRRQDADILQQKIAASFKSGAISRELAQTLMDDLKNQEIEVDTPDFKFKGKILTAEQEQSLIQTETELNQEMVDRRTTQIQQGIEDINTAESKGELLGGQAQSKRLAKQIEIDKERLENAKKTEEIMLNAYGEKSPQYVKAVQDRRAAERQIEKDSYDKQLATDNYYTERRVKLREQAIARIKTLEDTQRLTAGQAQIQSLEQEQVIGREQAANIRKRMARMKDTTSDAYKDLQQQLEQVERDGQSKRFQAQKAREDYSLDRRVKTHEDAIAKIQTAEQTLLKTQGQAQQETLRQEIAIAGERLKLESQRLQSIGKASGVGSDVYKDKLREVQTLEREIATKTFQEQRAQEDYAVERRVKVRQDAIAQIQAAEQTLTRTQGQAQQETLRQEIAISNERVKLARARLADIGRRAGTGSDTYKDQLLEVNNLEREIEVKRFQEQKAREDYALERRVKVRQDAIAQIQAAEQTLTKTQGQANQETLRQEIAISTARTKLARARLEDIGRRAGTASDSYKDQLLEVNSLEREIEVKRFQEQRAREDYALDRRVKVHEDAIGEIKLAETLLQKTQFEASQATLQEEIAITGERIKLTRARVESVRQNAGETSDIYKDQVRELRALEREQIAKTSQMQTAETLRGLEVQQQRIANQVEATTQAYKAQTNAIDLITARLSQQQELAESRNSLIQTATSGTQQQLELVGKLVNDERLSGQLQLTSAKARLAALEQSQKFERDNVKRQQEQKALSLDRQKIDLAGAKLANDRAIQDENINFRKLQANQKLTQEQIDQHNLALSNLSQQSQLLEGQTRNLQTQIDSQAELVANADEELNIRQQQAKDGGVMDVMLAKQSSMIAQLNKETEILQKRQEFNKSRVEAYASSLSLLSQTVTSERKQKDIAAAIAAIKLNSLDQQHVMERRVLEMQLKQKEAVLEQEKSRIRMMEAENKARTAEAKERVGLAIEEGKSTEQISTRIEALKGYLEAGAAIKSAGIAVDERGKFEKQMGQLEILQQQQQFVGERQQRIGELAQASSTGRQRSLNRYLRGDILNQLGTDFSSIQSLGRTTTNAVLTGGYDQRRAFAPVPELKAPKPVDYEAIRKDYLSQLSEFVIPDRKKTATTQRQQQETATIKVQQEVAAMRKNLEAILTKAKPSVDQKNTFNIHLPVGSTEDQAKSLEEPLIKLQMDLWKKVRGELGS
jgi:hypothetical protein